MHFDRTNTYNLEGAIHGMRNPMSSWKRSDSYFGIVDIYDSDVLTDVCDTWLEYKGISLEDYDKLDEYIKWLNNNGILSTNDNYEGLYNVAFLGPNDLTLAQKLVLAGDEHAKFMRQIFVSVDITAPLYWWKEFDTYKVGTVANSTSTMHRLSAEPITMNMFEFDNLDVVVDTYTSPHGGESIRIFSDYAEDIVDMCENLRLKFIETGDAAYWKALIQILPNAYLQTRTVTMSYANLRNIYFQRQHHKLTEWHEFCGWIQTLPYSKELITLGGDNETH